MLGPMRVPLALLLAAAPAFAALPETVVVEARLPRPAATASPSVTRLDGEDLAEQGRRDLAAALGDVPGVVALSQSGEGSQTSLLTRGTASNHTALLLDGRRLSPGFSGSYEPGRYRLGGLASVEVHRGATSSLYGANALGGVVDLRLRDPLADETGLGLGAEAGSFGRAGLFLSVLERAGRDLGWVGDLSATREDGWRGNARREAAAFTGKAVQRLGPDLAADLVLSTDRALAGLPGQRGPAGDDPNDWQRDSGWLVSPGLSLRQGDLRAQAFWSRSETAVTSFVDGADFFGPYVYHQRFLVRRDELTALAETKLGDLTLSGGVTYERAVLDQIALDPFSLEWADTQEGAALWARAEWKVGVHDRLTMGLRRDRFTDFGGKTTGELAWTRSLGEDLVAHARLATAFRAPAPNDLAYGTSGDRPLRPESNRSTELGLRRRPSGALGAGWTLVAFENRLVDLIDYDPADNYRTFNIGRATTRGLEAGVDAAPALGWRVRGSATWLEAVAESALLGLVQPGERLLRRPDLALGLSVEHRPSAATTLGLGAVWLRGREDFDFNTGGRVDLADAFQARLWVRHALDARTDLTLRVENLTGDDAELTSIGYPSPPRAAYLGLTRRF
jgi:vitamin B12 transporter